MKKYWKAKVHGFFWQNEETKMSENILVAGIGGFRLVEWMRANGGELLIENAIKKSFASERKSFATKRYLVSSTGSKKLILWYAVKTSSVLDIRYESEISLLISYVHIYIKTISEQHVQYCPSLNNNDKKYKANRDICVSTYVIFLITFRYAEISILF